MQQHPADLAARWLEQAQEDMAAIPALLADGRPNLVCFLAQQAAEKALKAALVWERGDFPRIHLIRELTNELLGTGLPLDAELRARLLTLDKYYLTTRYPDVLDYALPAQSFAPAEAQSARAIAQEAIDEVRAHLVRVGALTNKQR